VRDLRPLSTLFLGQLTGDTNKIANILSGPLVWLVGRQRYVSPNNQLLGISRSQSTELQQVFVDVINRIYEHAFSEVCWSKSERTDKKYVFIKANRRIFISKDIYLYMFLKSDNIESKNIKYRFSLAYSKKCFLLFLCLIMFI